MIGVRNIRISQSHCDATDPLLTSAPEVLRRYPLEFWIKLVREVHSNTDLNYGVGNGM